MTGCNVPALAFFLNYNDLAAVSNWGAEIARIWKDYVRFIAIGGMLTGAFYTLYKMRGSLVSGITRSVTYLRQSAAGSAEVLRTDRDISLRWSIPAFAVIGLLALFGRW